MGDDEDCMKRCVERITQDVMGMVTVLLMMMMGGVGSSKKMEEVGVYTGQGRNCSRGLLLSYSSCGCPFTLMCGRSRRGVWEEAQDCPSGAAEALAVVAAMTLGAARHLLASQWLTWVLWRRETCDVT